MQTFYTRPYHKITQPILFYIRKNTKTIYSATLLQQLVLHANGLSPRRAPKRARSSRTPGAWTLHPFQLSSLRSPSSTELIATGHRGGDTASVMKTAQHVGVNKEACSYRQQLSTAGTMVFSRKNSYYSNHNINSTIDTYPLYSG